MSPTSAIIFIKCRNWYHMKNIRYKGNINNTSVITFFKLSCCCSSFHFCSSFCCCCFAFFLLFLILLLFFIFVVVLQRHASPFRGLSPGFYTHFILSAQPIAEWSTALHFNLSEIFFHSFTASATFLSGHFLPTGAFLRYAASPTFYLRLSRPPWEPAVLPWSLKGFILILETQARPICLFDSQ